MRDWEFDNEPEDFYESEDVPFYERDDFDENRKVREIDDLLGGLNSVDII